MADKDLMQTARGRIALYAGFFLALGSKMQWKADPKCPGGVAATDGLRVYYNPENLNKRPIGEVVFIALHEIGHPLLAHLRPPGNRNRTLVNIAKDIVLNEILEKISRESPSLKMKVPADACTAAGFNVPTGLTWEAVYDLLRKQCKKSNNGKPDPEGQGWGQFDEHLDPTNEDGTPMNAQQQEALAKEWKMHAQATAMAAKMVDKLPGCLEELIADMVRPKIDWESHLRQLVSRVSKDESSYRRFNRRHLGRRVYLPGQYSEHINAVGYFCDTSGSISSKEFKAAMGSMSTILEDFKPDRIYFGQCDTQLHAVDEFTPDDLPLPPLTVKGRGGTDMREAFEWACQHEQDIDVFILQTDGYIAPLPVSCIPNVPVIWIVTTNTNLPAGCDFGSVVRVEV